MTDKKIIISADISQAKRELGKLTQELSKKQSMGIKVGQEASSVFSGEATKHVQSLNRALSSLPGMRSGGGGPPPIPMAGGRMGGVGGGGLSNIMSSFGGAVGIGKFMTVAGAVAAVGSRLYSSYGAAKSASQQYLTLRSLGMRRENMQDAVYQGMNNLYSPEETRGMTTDFMRNVGYPPNDRLLNMMQGFGRAWGVDSGTMGSTTSAIYKAGGSEARVYKEEADILASAIGAKLDRGKISEYLQTVAASIESMASQTAGVSTGNISAMLGLINGMGGAMTPSSAAGNLSKLDQSLRNPDQKQAAMTYSTIAQTLKQGGFEGDLPSAIRVIQETGLIGLKPDELEAKFPNLAKSGKLGEYKKIFGAWSPVNYTKNLAGNIEAATAGNTTLGGLYGGRFFQGGPTATSEFIEATKSKKFSNEEAASWIDKMGPQTEATLSDVVNSQEGVQAKLETLNKFNTETIGNKLLPLVQDIQRVLLNIESLIMPILKPMIGVMKMASPLSMLSSSIDNLDQYDQANGGNTAWGKAKKWLYGTSDKEYDPKDAGGGFTTWDGYPKPSGDPAGADNKPDVDIPPVTGINGNINFKNAGAEKGYGGLTKQMQEDLAALSMPITITSGKRSWAENASLAGHAKYSKHLTGEAADISIKNMSQAQIDKVIGELKEKGYKAFVHSGPGVAPHIHTEVIGNKNKAIMPSDIVAHHHN